MTPIWLIEAGVYGAEADPLIAEIRRQGMPAAVVPYQSLAKGPVPVDNGRPLGDGECVIGYGTFPFIQQIRLHQPWRPGGWCTPENFDCATYFAHFGRYLLNQHYAILPGVEAIRQRDWLFSVFGRDDEVFVRPSGCQKLFVGRCVTRDAFAAALAPTRYDPATLVVLAAPKPIDREWRLVVADDRVIAGSQYAVDGKRAIIPDFPVAVNEFAAAMLSEVRWRPDPIFMLDVCESEGRLWLVELNSFSSSWLYRCDLAAVVAAAGEIAARTWERAQAAKG
jgi:hypothetical protein